MAAESRLYRLRVKDSGFRFKFCLWVKGVFLKVYLNPEEPTFSGFFIMIYIYKPLKR